MNILQPLSATDLPKLNLVFVLHQNTDGDFSWRCLAYGHGLYGGRCRHRVAQPTFGSLTLFPLILTEPCWLFSVFFDLKRGLPKFFRLLKKLLHTLFRFIWALAKARPSTSFSQGNSSLSCVGASCQFSCNGQGGLQASYCKWIWFSRRSWQTYFSDRLSGRVYTGMPYSLQSFASIYYVFPNCLYESAACCQQTIAS